MNKPSNLLKIKDVADMLGVTTRTVYRRIWAGELPATKIGGLYYIKQGDLESILGGSLPKITPVSQTAPLKCGVCLRILSSSDQVGSRCAFEACDAVICRECATKGYTRCRQHVVSGEEKWQRASAAMAAGEIHLLVRNSQARLREMNYLNRIHSRLAEIETLLHPLSGELVTISDWESLLARGDERAEVLRLKGSVLLNSQDLSEIPVNAWLRYTVPAGQQPTSRVLQIKVQVLSRLRAMLQDGYDTMPYTAEELSQVLVRLNDDLSANQAFHILVLASTSGWDEKARQVVTGTPLRGSTAAFSHPRLLLYLYDLESDELIYHEADVRSGQYAEMFKPILLSEEVREVSAAVTEHLSKSGHSSLTLEDAVKILPYPARVIRESFFEMEKSGRYRVVELPDLGIAIQQKQLF